MFKAAAEAARPADEWNSLWIRCEKQQISVILNDTPLDEEIRQVEFFKKPPLTGFVGFGNLKGSGNGVSFKDIRIRKMR